MTADRNRNRMNKCREPVGLVAGMILILAMSLLGHVSTSSASGIAPITPIGLTVNVTVDCGFDCNGFSLDWGDSSPFEALPAGNPVIVPYTYATGGTYCIQRICFAEPCDTGCATDCVPGNLPTPDPDCREVTVTGGTDLTPPSISITAPTAAATYGTRASPIPLSGSASDDVGVTGVVWANDRGGSGSAAGTTSWSVSTVTLQPGVNVITVTAQDASTKTGNDVLTVTYDNGAPTIQITGPTSAAAYTTDTSPLTLS